MSGAVAVAALAERVWQRKLAREPYFRLRVGLPVESLPADSLEEAEQDASFARGVLAEVSRLDRASLALSDLLTLEFIEHAAQVQHERPAAWWSSFPVTPYQAYGLAWYVQQVFQTFGFADESDGERYLSMLGDFAGVLDAARHRLEQQAGRGWRIPRPALPGVRGTLQGIRGLAMAALPPDPSRLVKLSSGARDRIAAAATEAVERQVGPAFDRLLGAVGDSYARTAGEEVGMGRFPGGTEAYAMWVRHHMTFGVTPDDLCRLGQEEVARLTDEMAAVRASLGFDGTEAEFRDHLAATGRLHARSAEEVEARYRQYIERMRPLVGRAFRALPRAEYDVQRLDPSAEAGMSYGYYEVPGPAEPRGLYRYNGSGLESRSQLSAAALIYHELVPGHHFHLARQAENEALPPIRRHAIDLTVFNEGWAEYASGLAGELGLYDDPYDRYGRLVHERFTAQRLVTDTGLNVFGWSLDRARDYMSLYTLESPGQIATETLRYSTDLPAQALAYRAGFLKFRELRDTVSRALGPAFDLADFHEAILGQGALPFAVLERRVEQLTRNVARS